MFIFGIFRNNIFLIHGHGHLEYKKIKKSSLRAVINSYGTVFGSVKISVKFQQIRWIFEIKNAENNKQNLTVTVGEM